MTDSPHRFLRRLALRVGGPLGGRARSRRAARDAASAQRSARRVDARATADADRARHANDRVLADLRAELSHAEEQLALYRRRTYLGRGEPRRLAELERVAEGAAQRLRRAEEGAGR